MTLGGHETVVRPYPISIEWPPAALAKQKTIAECRQAVRERLKLGPEAMIGVGVERFDYTKGVFDRLRGVDELLTRHPEWNRRFVFVQAAAPTRTKLSSYKELQDEALALAQYKNEKHGDQSYKPVRLIIRHHEPDEVFELFRASDICVVSSLHDGMNLVAKEFVASRDDEEGVLILSHFTGASRELSEAIIVNPYDPHGLGNAMNEALTMPNDEQRARMRLMRTLVRERNVYRWAGQMLIDAAQLRRRRQVLDLVRGTARQCDVSAGVFCLVRPIFLYHRDYNRTEAREPSQVEEGFLLDGDVTETEQKARQGVDRKREGEPEKQAIVRLSPEA